MKELGQLLKSPVIYSNPAASAEIAKDIDAAVILLSQSIGIRTASAEQANVAAEVSLDGGHVGALLQTPKGKNLVGRSIKLLLPEHRLDVFMHVCMYSMLFVSLLSTNAT